VNLVTNKIYVANCSCEPGIAFGKGSVTVIDGMTNSATTVAAGPNASWSDVNPATNKIYLLNTTTYPNPETVTVIDGATNNIKMITGQIYGYSLAVNPVTNKIYVPSNSPYPGGLIVIDGETNSTSNMLAGLFSYYVAVNPLTNKIYAAYPGLPSAVTVIDGATNSTTTIAAGAGLPVVNPATNKIYIANTVGDVTVIDGATNTATALAAGTDPYGVAVNPVTGRVYVTNLQSQNVTVIDEQQVGPTLLTAAITPLPGDRTDNAAPSFTFSASSKTGLAPENVFFRVDTWQNAWGTATGSNPSFEGQLANLQPGFHILYAFADDGQDATATQTGSPLTGNIQAYGFLVTPTPASVKYLGLNTTTEGDWTGSFGADGQIIANDTNNPPSYATVSPTGDKLFTWAASTTDPRALQTASGSSTRIASTYYSASSFTIDVNLTDGYTHNVSLYLLDWDSTARAETISILDANTNKALNTEQFSGFHNGDYAVWEVRGHVLIQVTRTAGANAVVSGIFFE
jgi:DNA-binding beta-propeller fold protein YncE